MLFFKDQKIKVWVQEAIDYTLSKIKHSSNLIPVEEQEFPQYQSILSAMDEMRAIEIPFETYSHQWIQNVAELAKYYGVGNCCEKACVAYMFLVDRLKTLNINIELYNNPILDHFFVVVGRSPHTNSADPRDWNLDTLICDPWDEGKSYFLGEVDFAHVRHSSYRVIQYLLSDSQEDLMLTKAVLAQANNISHKIIHEQELMVLRARYNLKTKEYEIFNKEVPIAYEIWDYPTLEDYSQERASSLDEQSGIKIC